MSETKATRTTTKPEPRWVTIRAAADYLSCDTKTVRRLISNGSFEAVRLGSRAIRLDQNQIDAFMRPIPSAKVD